MRFSEYRRHNIPVYHECKDVNLAVWVDAMTTFDPLRRADICALQSLQAEKGIGVALPGIYFSMATYPPEHYLGRLCDFNQCPKGQLEFLEPGCVKIPFLKQHSGFEL